MGRQAGASGSKSNPEVSWKGFESPVLGRDARL